MPDKSIGDKSRSAHATGAAPALAPRISLLTINRLRAKIEENPDNPQLVLTVWGIGYKFTDAE